MSPSVEKLVRLLDKMQEQHSEITRLRERNEELEVLLRSAVQELAFKDGGVPTRFRREWLAQHDPQMLRFRGLPT